MAPRHSPVNAIEGSVLTLSARSSFESLAAAFLSAPLPASFEGTESNTSPAERADIEAWLGLKARSARALEGLRA